MLDCILILFSLAIGYIVGRISKADKNIDPVKQDNIFQYPPQKQICRRKGCKRECYSCNGLCIDHAFGM